MDLLTRLLRKEMSQLFLNWDSGHLPPNLDFAYYNKIVLAEIVAMEMDDLSDLMFHTVLLGKDTDGPSIFVLPGEMPGYLDCFYHAVTKWTTLSDLQKDIDSNA